MEGTRYLPPKITKRVTLDGQPVTHYDMETPVEWTMQECESYAHRVTQRRKRKGWTGRYVVVEFISHFAIVEGRREET